MRSLAFRFIATVCTLLVLVLITELRAAPVHPGNRVQFIGGEEAQRLIEAHVASSPAKRASFEKSIKLLRDRGYKPTGEYTVMRFGQPQLTQVQKLVRLVVPIAYAQDTFESNSNGYMMTWSWDDDDDSTHEGWSYVSNDAETVWMDAGWQLDVSSSGSYSVQWADGSNSSSGSGYPNSSAVATWATCTLSACATAYTACWLSGPAWFKCGSAWCAGGAVGCGVGAVMSRVFHQTY